MSHAAFSDTISAAKDELTVEIATSPAQILEAQRLRYKVYCEERGFEPGANGLEQDAFDETSGHVLVRSRVTGAVCGTVRVILSPGDAGHDGFPMRRACERYVLAPLPASATGEVSRFALTRHRPSMSPAAAALMRVFLMRGIVQVSSQNALTHWCAVMERSLLRLLRATAIHFEPVGPTVEYHGIRQPAIATISALLGRAQREQPLVWALITDNGAFWSEQAVLAQPSPENSANSRRGHATIGPGSRRELGSRRIGACADRLPEQVPQRFAYRSGSGQSIPSPADPADEPHGFQWA